MQRNVLVVFFMSIPKLYLYTKAWDVLLQYRCSYSESNIFHSKAPDPSSSFSFLTHKHIYHTTQTHTHKQKYRFMPKKSNRSIYITSHKSNPETNHNKIRHLILLGFVRFLIWLHFYVSYVSLLILISDDTFVYKICYFQAKGGFHQLQNKGVKSGMLFLLLNFNFVCRLIYVKFDFFPLLVGFYFFSILGITGSVYVF